MRSKIKTISLSPTITGFNRTSSTNSSGSALSLTLLALMAMACTLAGHAQRRLPTFPVPTYTAPVYHPPAVSVPQQRVQSEPQYQPRVSPAPQQQVQQQRQAVQQQQQAQKQAQQQQQQAQKQAQQQQQQAQRQQQQQQKIQAKQQKELLKQQQEQQKQQARKQQDQEKELAKRQQEQVRQQREQPPAIAKSAPSSSALSFAATPRASTAAALKSPSAAVLSGKNPSVASVLTPRKSRSTIKQLNSARANMSGINQRPLPSGQVTLHPNGGVTVKAEDGREYGVRSNGTVASYRDSQRTVSFDNRGQVRSIHEANLDVYHGAQGRSIVSRHADGVKVVNTGRHNGYVERTVVVNNRTYAQRTVIINQHAYLSTFVVNRHGGIVVASYVPPVFFAPRFYSWAYYPWGAPIAFTWGWYGAPWYGGPSPYFVASPLYPSPAFWLTDYLIGETLATAYQLHNDSASFSENGPDGASAGPEMSFEGDGDVVENPQQPLQAETTTPISPEIKTQLAEEVKRVLADDNSEASNPGQASFDVLPAALQSPNHVFVLSTDLSVTTADQQLCALQAGDMLQVASPSPADSNSVSLRVASSKRGDCPTGVLVNVSLPDVQEMQNNFQAQVESGLAMLHSGQTTAGLPALPPPAAAAPSAALAGLPPLTAADSSAMLDQQSQQADQLITRAKALAF